MKYYYILFFISGLLTPVYSQCISGDCVNGKGVSIRPTGNKYEGEFKNEKMDGKGTYYWTTGQKYEGEFKNGKREGNGTFYGIDGYKYEGEYKNDAKDGYGTLYVIDGEKYEGEFKNDNIEGKGVYYYSNGDKFEGSFQNGIKEGYGTYYYSLGSVFRGYYKNNKREGSGEFSIPGFGTVKGMFINGSLEGEGVATFVNGSKYIGNFNDFSPNGYGKEYNKNGELIYEGEYKNGVKVGDNFAIVTSSVDSNIDLTDSENEEKIRKIIYRVTVEKVVKNDKSNSNVLESRIIKAVESEILMRKATQKDLVDIKNNIKYTSDLLQLSEAITPKTTGKCDLCGKKISGKGFNYEVRNNTCVISDIYLEMAGFKIFCSEKHAYDYCRSKN